MTTLVPLGGHSFVSSSDRQVGETKVFFRQGAWPTCGLSLDPHDARSCCRCLTPPLGMPLCFVLPCSEAFDAVEAVRAKVVRTATVMVQRIARGWVSRRSYTRTHDAVLTLQAAARGMAARSLARRLRCERGAVRIQASIRRSIARTRCVHRIVHVGMVAKMWLRATLEQSLSLRVFGLRGR